MTGPELERLRAEMLELLSDPRAEEFWDGLASKLGHAEAGRSASDLRKVFFFGLTNASLYSVDAASARFAEAQALETDAADLASEDLPSPHGLLVFEEPVTGYRVVGDGRDVRVPITGLLWTDVSSADGVRGVATYALTGDVYMPAFSLVLAYGRRPAGVASDQSVYFKVMQVCWRALRKQAQADAARLETRTATLPDGHRITIAVKRGLSQDEVDLLAARIWQEIPESGE